MKMSIPSSRCPLGPTPFVWAGRGKGTFASIWNKCHLLSLFFFPFFIIGLVPVNVKYCTSLFHPLFVRGEAAHHLQGFSLSENARVGWLE